MKFHSIHSQRGLSLIEAMIGIVLGLLVVGAMVAIVTNTSRTRSELDKTGQQIENGRFAIQLLGDDLHHAGYYGEFWTGTFGTLPADPCSTVVTDLTNNLQLPVQDGAACTGLTSASDILVIRRANSKAICADADIVTGEYYVQANSERAEVQIGEEVSAFSFGTTSANGNPTTMCKRVHDPDAACPTLATPISANASGACVNRTAATIRKLEVHVYYVGTHNNGIPTLRRRVLGVAGFSDEPLVEGIENLQIEYGIDDASDGIIDRYTSAPTNAVEWANVLAVRIHVLARNQQPTTGHVDGKDYILGDVTIAATGDNYKRHVFTSTVSLNNPAGRRIVP